MTNEQTRADFEAFYAQTDEAADFRRSLTNGADYCFDEEQNAWIVWQAATAKANQAWEAEFIAAMTKPLPPTATEPQGGE